MGHLSKNIVGVYGDFAGMSKRVSQRFDRLLGKLEDAGKEIVDLSDRHPNELPQGSVVIVVFDGHRSVRWWRVCADVASEARRCGCRVFAFKPTSERELPTLGLHHGWWRESGHGLWRWEEKQFSYAELASTPVKWGSCWVTPKEYEEHYSGFDVIEEDEWGRLKIQLDGHTFGEVPLKWIDWIVGNPVLDPLPLDGKRSPEERRVVLYGDYGRRLELFHAHPRTQKRLDALFPDRENETTELFFVASVGPRQLLSAPEGLPGCMNTGKWRNHGNPTFITPKRESDPYKATLADDPTPGNWQLRDGIESDEETEDEIEFRWTRFEPEEEWDWTPPRKPNAATWVGAWKIVTRAWGEFQRLGRDVPIMLRESKDPEEDKKQALLELEHLGSEITPLVKANLRSPEMLEEARRAYEAAKIAIETWDADTSTEVAEMLIEEAIAEEPELRERLAKIYPEHPLLLSGVA